jgi:hypothetical protein
MTLFESSYSRSCRSTFLTAWARKGASWMILKPRRNFLPVCSPEAALILELTEVLGGMAKIIEAHRRHGRYISPSVDNFARILFALIGGIFLLAPMVAMAYITSTKYLLVTTVLFVLIFAVILALSSKASNQELVAATAAYAAVLVVFVGNNIGLVSRSS